MTTHLQFIQLLKPFTERSRRGLYGKQPEVRAKVTRCITCNDRGHSVDLSTLHAIRNRTTWMLQNMVQLLGVWADRIHLIYRTRPRASTV
jgi:hypothetical protein